VFSCETMSQPPHSWQELDWCLAHSELTQVVLPESDLKNARFEKSEIGRMDGTGCYEYSADLKAYRVHNLIRFGDPDARYFTALVRVATMLGFVSQKVQGQKDKPVVKKPQHSWDELELCIQYALKTQFHPTQEYVKHMQFERSKEGRKNGIGFYEYCAKTRTYRCNNIFDEHEEDLYFRASALPTNK
jgi:hypothetical protein